jgi:hypothetical protein
MCRQPPLHLSLRQKQIKILQPSTHAARKATRADCCKIRALILIAAEIDPKAAIGANDLIQALVDVPNALVGRPRKRISSDYLCNSVSGADASLGE